MKKRGRGRGEDRSRERGRGMGERCGRRGETAGVWRGQREEVGEGGMKHFFIAEGDCSLRLSQFSSGRSSTMTGPGIGVYVTHMRVLSGFLPLQGYGTGASLLYLRTL